MKNGSAAKCESCGSMLLFDPKTQTLKCNRCGNHQKMRTSTVYSRTNVDLNNITTQYDRKASVIGNCPSCGASYSGDVYAISANCPYCGSQNMVSDIDTMPDALIRYAFDKNDAKSKFELGFRNYFWAPRSFKRNIKDAIIDSVYIPAYRFLTTSTSKYSGTLQESKTDRNGNESYSYRQISGNKYMSTETIVECSRYLTQSDLISIQPYKTEDAVAFDERYIYGYVVEYEDKPLSVASKNVKELNDNKVRRLIDQGYTSGSVYDLSLTTTYESASYSRILLPTYRLKKTYNGKTYISYMNGQTGKLKVKAPVSKFKIALIVAGVLAFILLLI